MDSGMIGKIQKAKFYAEEPERIRFEQFRATFQGTNSHHKISFEQGQSVVTGTETDRINPRSSPIPPEKQQLHSIRLWVSLTGAFLSIK